jgi:hypothetical protein
MTAPRPLSFAPVAAPRTAGPTTVTTRRERDFGVGYGRSSGYAAPRRYIANASLPQFRFA